MANIEVIQQDRSVPAVHARQRSNSVFEEHVLLYTALLPLMQLIGFYAHAKKRALGLFDLKPNTNSFFFDGVSLNGRRTKEGAARWPALDTVYNFRSGEGRSWIERTCDDLWMNIRNAQAVRNRLKIVKSELRNAVQECARTTDEPVRILSLAAGTAQGVLEAMSELKADGFRVKALLVDRDMSALNYARRLIAKYKLEDDVVIQVGDVIFFEKASRGYNPHIVEMCGLMDYLSTTLAEKLVRKIFKNLVPGGFFVTCHIHPNAETYFLRHVVDWDMIYRSVAEFKDILVNGNFLAPRLVTEPHEIHSVATAQKPQLN